MQKLTAQTDSVFQTPNSRETKLQPSLSLNSVMLTMDSSLWSTKYYLNRSHRYHYMVMSQKYESFFFLNLSTVKTPLRIYKYAVCALLKWGKTFSARKNFNWSIIYTVKWYCFQISYSETINNKAIVLWDKWLFKGLFSFGYMLVKIVIICCFMQ